MSNSFQDDFEIEALQTKDGDGEAERRFNLYKSLDPFPEIIPALLNSADIYDYVRVTGMMCPFDPDPKKLKSASYAVPILGTLIYWDEQGNKQEDDLENDQEFILKPNSIAFVSIEPILRIPDYIALRFNLKITHIHRGILLGTGPLVDPGYVGKLLIPLHNLTTNEYTFRGGEDLIWMEFTKLSNNDRWYNSNPNSKRFIHTGTLIKYNSTPTIQRTGSYVPFPSEKSLNDVKRFLAKASPHKPIRSSLPDVIFNAKKSVKDAAKKAEDAAKTAESIRNFIAWGVIITVAITFVALIIPIYSLVQDSINYVKDTNDVKKEYEQTINELKTTKERYKEKINQLEMEIKSLREDVEKLSQSSDDSSVKVSDATKEQ